jgi:hypothetical protein
MIGVRCVQLKAGISSWPTGLKPMIEINLKLTHWLRNSPLARFGVYSGLMLSGSGQGIQG